MFLGLEFRQPDLSYVEKEKLLNQAAYSGLPLDPGTYTLIVSFLIYDENLFIEYEILSYERISCLCLQLKCVKNLG